MIDKKKREVKADLTDLVAVLMNGCEAQKDKPITNKGRYEK